MPSFMVDPRIKHAGELWIGTGVLLIAALVFASIQGWRDLKMVVLIALIFWYVRSDLFCPPLQKPDPVQMEGKQGAD